MKIEFISYDGKFPNLCSGELTLRIDGEYHQFSYYNGCHPSNHKHDAFWTSGGSYEDSSLINITDIRKQFPWLWNEYTKLPEFLKGHEQELLDIFNKNVEWGCCGGCD